MQVATFLAYLLAAALFIVGIRRLRSPETARSGNTLAAVGMVIALVATLFVIEFESLLLIGIATLIGSVVGALTAQRVQMTAMPQMVAAYNGLGGGAAALIALSEFLHVQAGGDEASFVAALTVPLTILIGSVSFMGSVVAFLKLQELAFSGSVTFPLQQIVNALLFVGILVLAANAITDGTIIPALSPVASVVAVLVASAVLGVLLVIPIGGADMPIVISLLNAFTGLAAAASGFVLENYILIIGGTIVGASGTILTRLMSSALGRPLGKIIFAGIAASSTSKKDDDGEEKPVNDVNAGAVGEYLADEAQKVIIIPGYGLAVAQAQGAMRELMEALEADGKEVLFGIHPVAGRMPGHMNVLLTEAGVPYDKLYDLEDINPEFPDTDAVIIVGANDVVNPAANDPEQDTPISGMPVLAAEQAKRVIFIKRSLSPGFAGVDNPLFYDTDKTMMLFSDAKQGLQEVVEAVKNG